MTTAIRESHAGKPFFCISKNGGAQMMAKNPDRRKVTMMDSAARIPAMTITNAARTNKVREELE